MECVFGRVNLIRSFSPAQTFQWLSTSFRAKAQFLSIVHKTLKDSVVLLCHWPYFHCLTAILANTLTLWFFLPQGLWIDHSLCLITLPPDIYMLAPLSLQFLSTGDWVTISVKPALNILIIVEPPHQHYLSFFHTFFHSSHELNCVTQNFIWRPNP